ncbi:hypothetical protein ACMZOO_08665 [Catenovulum sp. SX2]|uniref:hypothetical protein n=1 Tax=Catenovulum sp. SX2 TaxID=3398614 RepID=UPI003F86E4E3
MKTLLLVAASFAAFLGGGVLIAERPLSEDWLWATMLFLAGYQWVYPFLLSRTMYTLYIAEPLYANSDKHKLFRLFHFIIGLVLCVGSSVV